MKLWIIIARFRSRFVSFLVGRRGVLFNFAWTLLLFNKVSMDD